MQHPIFTSKLRSKTKELLTEHLKYKSNTIIDIANSTGLGANWIGMFYANKINNPDVGRVETLYNHLSSTPLEV
jgi:hypothetical protein